MSRLCNVSTTLYELFNTDLWIGELWIFIVLRGYYNILGDCPDGDNEQRMRYFVRYVYDADDDGL